MLSFFLHHDRELQYIAGYRKLSPINYTALEQLTEFISSTGSTVSYNCSDIL